MSANLNKKQQLEIYISQGKAMKKLLVSTNIHGKHDRKIARLSKKIATAQKALAKIK